MSLINDALKRARQAQQPQPPPVAPGPAFRPVEPAVERGRHPSRMLTPVLLIGTSAAVVILGWALLHRSNPPQTVNANTRNVASADAAVPQPTKEPASPAVTSSAPRTPAQPDSTVAPTTRTAPAIETAAKTPAVPDQPQAAAPSIAPGASDVPATNTIAAATVAKSAPLRLQGIMFHPSHPAAMIAGKTLFVGDKLGDWRVIAIGAESATLVNSGQTNVLMLAQ